MVVVEQAEAVIQSVRTNKEVKNKSDDEKELKDFLSNDNNRLLKQ